MSLSNHRTEWSKKVFQRPDRRSGGIIRRASLRDDTGAKTVGALRLKGKRKVVDLLKRGAADLGIQLSPRQIKCFQLYYETLADWNRRVNLTAVIEPEEVQTRHFVDSLTVAQVIPRAMLAGGRFADVGSGGGFPGVPLKIAFPAISIALIEATAKKAAFLLHLKGVLSLLDVEVLAERVETLARQPRLRDGFDCVFVRAVAGMSALAELTLPLCRTGGIVVAQKSLGVEEELKASEKAIEKLGGGVKDVREVAVAGILAPRVLVVLEKRQPTPERYPRRPGIPSKRPLR